MLTIIQYISIITHMFFTDPIPFR